MNAEIERRRTTLEEEYGYFGDPQELFEYIIAKNKAAPPLPPELKRDEFLVKGCVSSLWLAPSFRDGKCFFQSDADSIVTRGVAEIVCGMYSGLTPDEVLSFDCSALDELGISSQLSPNRRNGLSQLCKRIADFAKLKKNAGAQ